MNEVKMNKKQLLSDLNDNRDQHVEEYDAALEGWRNDYHDQLSEAFNTLIDWNGGKTFHMSDMRPRSYEEDYNTMIAMLENDVRIEIDLSPEQFKQYVLNQWSWSNSFNMTNSKYI